jgi:serine/threonine-protein kinase
MPSLIPDKTQVRADPLIGQRLDGFVVVERIAEGVRGTLYKGHKSVEEQDAAIKIFRPDIATSEQLARQLEEISRASAIGCKAIAAVRAKGKLPDGRHYLVTEYFEGQPLDWLLRDRPRLPAPEAAKIADDIAVALEAAHAWRIVHGNLKPSNVLLTKDASGASSVKLLDFGLLGSASPDYVAPEQLRGEPPVSTSDLYALGAILYTLLTGRPPFEGTSEDVREQHLRAIAMPPSSIEPTVPQSLDRLIGELLQKDAEIRPTATAVHAWLRQFVPNAPGAPSVEAAKAAARRPALATDAAPRVPPGPAMTGLSAEMVTDPALSGATPSVVARRQSRKWFVVGAAVPLLVLAGLAAVFFWPSPPPQQPPPAAEGDVTADPDDDLQDPDEGPDQPGAADPQTAQDPQAAPGTVESTPGGLKLIPRHGVKAPRPVPTVQQLTDRMNKLEAKLRKAGAKDRGLEQDGLLRLNKQRLRLSGSPSVDDRKDVARELRAWQQVYLAH